MKSNLMESLGATIITGRKGCIIGAMLAICLVSFVILSPSRGPLLPDYGISSLSYLIIAIILPTVLGASISGSIIESFIIKKWILQHQVFQKSKLSSIIGTIFISILSIPVGIFLGLIIGTTWGGLLGMKVGNIFHLLMLGNIVGVATVLFSICIIIVVGSGFLGSYLGYSLFFIATRFMGFFQRS